MVSHGKLWGFSDVESYWPRRLLHIPTLTSVERDEEDVYAGVSQPNYSTLTYTWGRWKVRDGSSTAAMPISGTSWRIPSVQSHHFTVDSFIKVIKTMANDGFQWAWLDIACIDQEDDAMNADEVGHQAAIFHRAADAYIWLTKTPENELSSALETLNSKGLEIDEWHFVSERRAGYLHSSENRPSWASFPQSDLRIQRFIRNLQSVEQSLRTITQDPWFSSLWTLQEAILRDDAIMLGAEGQPGIWDTDANATERHVRLLFLANFCRNLMIKLKDIDMDLAMFKGATNCWQGIVQHKVEVIRALISPTGIDNMPASNPNIQYGMARYRRTSRAVDRVYGIMQIYNIRVGKSVRPNENLSLGQLVTEFASAIVKKNPLLSQMFVHTRPPDKSFSWRITQESAVPPELLFHGLSIQRSTFEMNDIGRLIVTGNVCPLPTMLQQYEDSHKWNRFPLYSTFVSRDQSWPHPRIITDAGFNLGPTHLHYDSNLYDISTIRSMTNPLVQDLWVLDLGHTRMDNSPTDRPRRPMPSAARFVGLLLSPVGSTLRGGPSWAEGSYQRVGVFTYMENTEGPFIWDIMPWTNVEFPLE